MKGCHCRRHSEAVPRTNGLAGVASIDTVSQAGGLLSGDLPTMLDRKIRDAFAGIQMSRPFQGPGGASVQTAGAGAATIPLGSVIGIDRQGRHDLSEEEKGAFARDD